MKIKVIVWTILFTFGICLSATAEKDKEQATCNAECSELRINQVDLDNNFSEKPETRGFETAQRTREDSTYGDDLKKVYLGGTVGFFLPSDIDDIQTDNEDFDFDSINSKTGFGGSAYLGYKFNNFLGADLELLAFGGKADPFDSSYTAAGFFINPRYTLPIGGNPNASPYVFVSPGIGVAGVGFGDDIEDRIDKDNLNTGVALQLKAGGGLPLSESIDVFGQARYFNAFKVYESSDNDNQGFSSLSLEAGLNFKL
jgi:hypothetical protein